LTRKSPVSHIVHQHQRKVSGKTYPIHQFKRGSGQPSDPTKPFMRITNHTEFDKPHAFTVNFRYNKPDNDRDLRDDGESVVVVSTNYDDAFNSALANRVQQDKQYIAYEIIDPDAELAIEYNSGDISVKRRKALANKLGVAFDDLTKQPDIIIAKSGIKKDLEYMKQQIKNKIPLSDQTDITLAGDVAYVGKEALQNKLEQFKTRYNDSEKIQKSRDALDSAKQSTKNLADAFGSTVHSALLKESAKRLAEKYPGFIQGLVSDHLTGKSKTVMIQLRQRQAQKYLKGAYSKNPEVAKQNRIKLKTEYPEIYDATDISKEQIHISKETPEQIKRKKIELALKVKKAKSDFMKLKYSIGKEEMSSEQVKSLKELQHEMQQVIGEAKEMRDDYRETITGIGGLMKLNKLVDKSYIEPNKDLGVIKK